MAFYHVLLAPKICHVVTKPNFAMANVAHQIGGQECWEVWKERNASIFDHRETPSFVVLAKIKDEASAWIPVEAKHLARLLGRV